MPNKNMKKTFFSFLILLTIFSVVVGQAWAQNVVTGTPTNRFLERQEAREEKKEEVQAQQMQNVKARADAEIARRVAALNQLINRVNAFEHLTEAQKSGFISQIQAQTTALNTLGSRIAADTTLEAMRADRKSIYVDYRIYMLFIPKMHVMAAADVVNEAALIMEETAAKIETRVVEAKAAGKDVSSLEALLADAKAKIADAKVQADNAVNAVSNLNPDKGDLTVMTANSTALQTAHAFLKTAREDLRAAREAGRKILEGLRALNFVAPTTSNVVLPNPSSTMGL